MRAAPAVSCASTALISGCSAKNRRHCLSAISWLSASRMSPIVAPGRPRSAWRTGRRCSPITSSSGAAASASRAAWTGPAIRFSTGMTARSAIPCTTAPVQASNVLHDRSLTGLSTRYSMAFSEKAPLSPWNATMGRTRQLRRCAPPGTSGSVCLARFPCRLRAELALVERSLLSDVGRRASDDSLRDLEQDDRLRLVDLQVLDRVRLDENEGKTRIAGSAVALPALVTEPCLPIGLVQLLDQIAVLGDGRDARYGDPLA